MNGGETRKPQGRRARLGDVDLPLMRDLGRIAALRAALSICLLIAGFRAVSDDDFARVVIAQQWAHSPTLDPSGTSWLPFPFWLNGAVMWLFGPSLFFAQLVAVLLGIVSACLITISAHQVIRDRKASLLVGGLSVVMGWPAWLGVSTVPELLTASFSLVGAASLTSHRERDRFWGALALLFATLSRYEPWPVALGFAMWTVISPAHQKRSDLPSKAGGANLPGRSRETFLALVRRLAPAALALLGPMFWIEWNRIAHGDRFHFVARVAAYHRAAGQAQSDSAFVRLFSYPTVFVREMPEVVLLLGMALILAFRSDGARRFEWVTAAIRRNAPLLVLSFLQGVSLSVSLVKDGAPTHHPERALLFPALSLLVFACDCANAAPKIVWGVPGRVVACLLFVRAIVAPVLLRSEATLRSFRGGWMLLYAAPAEAFANRSEEVDIGALAAEAVGPTRKIYFEGAEDYGYFAVQSAFGNPNNVLVHRTADPRNPQAPRVFENEKEQVEWLQSNGISAVVGMVTSPETTKRFGKTPVKWNGKYGVWVF